MSEKLNCETVAVSSWAVFAGLPVALWGLVGYFFMGGLCIWGLYKRRQPASWPFGILFWLSLFFVFVSIAMYVISHTFIGALCIICVATYVIANKTYSGRIPKKVISAALLKKQDK